MTRRIAEAALTAILFVVAVASAAASQPKVLEVSLAPDRADAAQLDGATLNGQVYVFLAAHPGISYVKFYLDNPKGSGTPVRLERSAPYDLGGGDEAVAKPFDTTTLSDGPHTVTASIKLDTGGTELLTAAFTVANSAGPVDTTPPTTPSTLTLATATATTLEVSWLAATDDVGVAGYGMYRNGELVATTQSTSFVYSGLECGTGYELAVDAYDVAGNRSEQRFAKHATAACDAQLPPPDDSAGHVLRVSGSSNRADANDLGGTSLAGVAYVFLQEAPGISGVDFYFDNPDMSGSPRQREKNAPYDFAGGSVDVANPFDTKTVSDGEHTITARVNHSDGETVVVHAAFTVENGTVIEDSSPPTAPTKLEVVDASETSVSLSWTASSDNVGVVGYYVYRNGTVASTALTTSATVTGLECGTTALAEVEAFDLAGNRSPRAAISVATKACPAGGGDGGDASVFLSPSGSDANSCTVASPCRSLARGYAVAQLGGIVQLSAGTYPDQLLPGKSAKSRNVAVADRVVFRPAPGATVAIGPLVVNVPHVEFRDMRIAKWKARYNVDDTTNYAAGNLTFRNIRTHHFSFNAVHNVSVIGGEVGPNRNPETGDWPQDGIFIGAYPADKHPPTNILIDGVYIHDIREPNADAHSDCIQFTAGVNVIIRNNRFRNCEHADMMIKGDQGPIENFLIENNYLDRTLSAYYSINLYETSRGCRNVMMRNNTALQNIRLDACSGGTLTGNIQSSMSSNTCSKATVKIDWNVYESGSTCGANDRVAAIAYVDRANFDLRLRVGSPATNRGNPHNFPGNDIFGGGRPLGGAPDAGAHEVG